MNVRKTLAVFIAVAIGSSIGGLARAQTAPASSKDAANPSARSGARADDRTQAKLENESKDTRPKRSTSSSVSPAPSTDHGDQSDQPMKKSNRATKRASPLAAERGKGTKTPSAETASKGQKRTYANPPQSKTP